MCDERVTDGVSYMDLFEFRNLRRGMDGVVDVQRRRESGVRGR